MTVKLKDLDFQVVAVGRPKSGKSYWLRRYVWAESLRTNGFVIVHDPADSWKEDRGVPHLVHHGVGELHAALKKHGGRVAHILEVDDVDQVLEAARNLAANSMARAQGGRFHPVYVVVDEAVDAEGLDPENLSPLWRKACAKRRHWGIGIAITMQSIHQAHRSIRGYATRIEVFGLIDDVDLNALRRIGLDRALLETVQRLPNREHVTIEFGRTTAVNGRPWQHGVEAPRTPARTPAPRPTRIR